MKIISLLYHDIVENGRLDSSGFPGGDADIYKVGRGLFLEHLTAIARRVDPRHLRVVRQRADLDGNSDVVLTFDDGGSAAYDVTAPLLEQHGRLGQFFVTTDFIGHPGFLTVNQIQALARRGHVIGSHSCSHPTRMAYCSPAGVQREWSESVRLLSDMLGEPVRTASLPGGYYARFVAEAAAEAGIEILFTSEPTSEVSFVQLCAVIGRYTIKQGLPASTAAAIAAGERWPRYRQTAFWNGKKVLKALGGRYWPALRTRILTGRPPRN